MTRLPVGVRNDEESAMTAKKKRARPAVIAIGAPWRWHESTPNCHVGTIGQMSVEVDRHRSWRRYAFSKPWRVRIFGNRAPGLADFASLGEAKHEAESVGEKWIAEVAMQIGGAR